MQKGKRLNGKYEIISEIKKGGFGIVYYGIDRNLNKPVAIKEIAPNLLQEARYVDMFMAEARNAAKLNHQNIVHIFDLLRTPDNSFYIIMEYVDGLDLHKVIKRARHKKEIFPINLATYITGEICKALEFAHNRCDSHTGKPLNLVHQDISPSNIMISIQGEVKLIDFGIAQVRYHQQQTHKPAGKLPYLSPEQIDQNLKVDNRSDIFSLGTVFFEMLTSERLFHGKKENQLAADIIEGHVDWKRLTDIRLPKTLLNILRRALHPEQDQRYQSANQMYLDLAKYLTNSGKHIDLTDDLHEFMHRLFLESETPIPAKITSPDLDFKSIETPQTPPDALSGKVARPIQKKIEQSEIQAKTTVIESEEAAKKTASEQQTDTSTPSKTVKNETVEPEANTIPTAETTVDNKVAVKVEPDPESAIPPEDEATRLIPNTTDSQQDIDPEPKTAPQLPKEPDTEPETRKQVTPAKKEKPDQEAATVKRVQVPKKKVQKDETVETAKPVFQKITSDPVDEGSMEDDVLTVIDAIRLKTRNSNGPLKKSLLGAGMLLVLWLILDSIFMLTPVGHGIRNSIFPPDIQIVTHPAGAEVLLDTQKLAEKTPLAIQNISPGLHQLILRKTGYPDLHKSISVPEKGTIFVDDKSADKGNKWTFHFLAELDIQSTPAFARVYLNDTRINQETPCTIQWEVGKPLTIEMEKEGFQRLKGFTFNLLDVQTQKPQSHNWRIQLKSDGTADLSNFQIHGYFRKMLYVQSQPTGAEILVDNNPQPIGKTGTNGVVYLTFGKHTLHIKKAGFLTQHKTLEIADGETASFNFILKRQLNFRAVNAQAPDAGDINARLVYLKSDTDQQFFKQHTPFTLELRGQPYTALFRKDGFADKRVTISPNQTSVTVTMQRQAFDLLIEVTDANTGDPVPEADIWTTELNRKGADGKQLGKTDANGRYQSELDKGQYIFKITHEHYYQKRLNYHIAKNKPNKLEFQLYPK
ncbi:protein kinase [bacterium]|nr:protein kinase [bacterium]